ncbi:hypothetical protein D3C72_1420970 [compost metagenome]
MTGNAREQLRLLIAESGKTLIECEREGVLEELVEDSTLFGSDHNEVLCVLEAWSGSPRRKLLLEYLLDDDPS